MPESYQFTFHYGFSIYTIPDYMRSGLMGYIERYEKPGNFLTAVLENDLINSVGRADENNLANLPAYACFLYNHAPTGCYGSKENVKAWLEKGREVQP